MKKISLNIVLIVAVFLLNINPTCADNFIEVIHTQSTENVIIVTEYVSKRKLTIDAKTKTINIPKGFKLNFETQSNAKNTCFWSFGEKIKRQGRQVSHQFNTTGKHLVVLKTLNAFNETSFSQLTIAVSAPPESSPNKILPPILSINDLANKESMFSLEQLVSEVLIEGECSTVGNFSVQVFGNPTETTTKNYGYFKKEASSDFPFEDGIVITTGNAFNAGNTFADPNRIYPTIENNLPGDADIEVALGITETFDSSFVKFDFIPLSETISFRFIMASEEYIPQFECDFSDGFAFLLREVGTANFSNLAVLPDGTPVRVTNINDNATCGINQGFFEGYVVGDTNYSGRTKVLTATSVVTPGATYELKLVVADALDARLDSAIFLEGGSFNLGGGLGDDITIANGKAGCEDIPVIIKSNSLGAIHTWYRDGVEIPGAGTGNELTVTQAGTYSVNINFGGTDCVSEDSLIVEFIPNDDATFVMTPNCNGGGTATILGTVGGVFSFDPAPTDGATIDPVTGTVKDGVLGTTYTIKYQTMGKCPDTSSLLFTPSNTGDATFTMTPDCDSATATITGTLGGVFSFNPVPTDGAVIDPDTGEISNGVPETTYAVEYTTAGACSNSSTQTVTLLKKEEATFNMTPTCDGATAIITGTTGGIFSFNPAPTDNAIIDPATGEINNGTSGVTYSVEYTTQGTCQDRSIVLVETLPPGNALFTIMSTCDGGEITISGDPGGVFSFDPIPTDGAVIDPVTGLVTNGTTGATYTIAYTVTNCFAVHYENLTILSQPPLDEPEPLTTCDDERTIGAFAFFDLESKNEEILEATNYDSVSYHDTQIQADNGTNPLISPYFSASRIVYVRAQDLTCYSTTTLELEVVELPKIISHTYALCDDAIELDDDASNDRTLFNLNSQNAILLNGQEPNMHKVSYHLNQADAESGSNSIDAPYENIINPQTIYVRIENKDTLCFSTGEMVLQVNPLPKIELQDKYLLCLDNEGMVILPTPVIDTGLSAANYAFQWFLNGELITTETNGSISVTQSGNYSVTATNIMTGCSASEQTIVIESAPPTIEAKQISITFVEDNTILATASNSGAMNALFEFKIDNGPWVVNVPNNNTYTFKNVSAGLHTVTARDLSGCGEASTTIMVLDFIPYFTPNGDGFHDTWNIIGLENQPDAKLYIFDRYGKLLKQLSPSGKGWDGSYNNNIMPTSDYWFTLQYRDPNTNKTDLFKSHFTLKR